MKYLWLIIPALLVTFTEPSFGKSAATLKTELASIMPSGMKARMVWCQKVPGCTDWSAYIVDSDNGEVIELTKATLFPGQSRNIMGAFLTRDGQKVVFTEEKSGVVYKINFDGNGLNPLLDGGCIGATWQNQSTRAQYVMVSDGSTSLYNLADITDKILVWNGGYFCTVGDNDGAGISVDGKKIGGFFENGSGIASIPNGAPVTNTCGGCNFAMRPVSQTAYEYCHFPPGHATIHIHNANGSLKENPDISSTVITWAQSNIPMSEGQPVDLTFTSNPDYVAYQWSGWKVNPIIYCLSSKKWVGLRDDMDGISVPKLDVVFIPDAGTSTIVKPRTLASNSVTGTVAYSINGRKIKTADPGKHSVRILVQSRSKASAVLHIE